MASLPSVRRPAVRRPAVRRPAARCPAALRLAIPLAALLALVACGAGAGTRGSPSDGAPAAQPAAQAGSGDRAVTDFYRGKTLHLVVGYDAGGGYDTYSRVIARYLGKHVPGNPNVIVENRPGAGGLVATNYLANAAPRDGTVLLNVGASSMLKQLAGDRGVEYDAARFQYLGAPFSDHNILIVRKSSGFTRLDEALRAGSRQMVLGGISPGSPQDVGAVLVRDVLGANVKLVSGYGGTSKIRLALDQGEIDGFFNAWESTRATNRAEIDNGDWTVLAQVTERPLADFPTVPTLLQLARNDEQRQVIRMASIAPLEFARPYLVAAGVPAARVVALRAAFDQTMADPEFLADAERSKLDIEPVSADRLQRLVAEFLDMPPNLKSQVVEILTAP
jgi:tripartite-type tricarboxylate transporter receptor subunit TctC